VLSACSTARYEEVETPAPPDLASALLLDGVPQVVATLWNADSSAVSRFMGAFYGAIRRGAAPLAAVREASEDVRRTPGWAHPYYWASMSLFVRQ
jgi:CHAT domain-containing protein